MTRARALQAEKKLQFLLQQNDIFKHFGLDATKAETKSVRSKGGRMTEKDGDSELMAADSDKVGTVLLKQPSILEGEMRAYQLEGLNWLIRNHENGINGILADEMGLGEIAIRQNFDTKNRLNNSPTRLIQAKLCNRSRFSPTYTSLKTAKAHT
jgi:hypothetical protein